MKKILTTFVSLAMLVPFVSAQDDEPKHLRFIPLGELPKLEELLPEGHLLFLEPPSGSMPPESVSLVSGDSVIPFELNLRVFTDILTMNGATEGLGIKNGKTLESPFLLKAPKPVAPLSLGVLYADPAKLLWKKPKMLLLKDDASAFPASTVRFVNVSDKVVIVQLGGKGKRPFGIAAGGSSHKPFESGVTLIRVGYLTADGSQKVIWQNQIKILSNQRVQCFFYKAVPSPGKDAVKFHYVTETIPKLPVK